MKITIEDDRGNQHTHLIEEISSLKYLWMFATSKRSNNDAVSSLMGRIALTAEGDMEKMNNENG